jgi:outer membrane protein OmpA-like peptidoglycan-associated protein
MDKKILSVVAVFVLSGLFSVDAQEIEEVATSTAVDIQTEGKYNAYKTTWLKNRFKDTWFITIGSGAQVLFGEDDSKADFSKRITYAPSLTIGKYFSPIWGLRLQLTGGTLHGFNDGISGIYRKWNKGPDNYQGRGYAGTPGYPNDADSKMLHWDPQWNYMGYTWESGQITASGDGYEWIPGRPGVVGGKPQNMYMQHVRYAAANLNFMFDLLTLFGDYNPRRVFEITPFAGISYAHVFPHMGNEVYDVAGVNGGLNAKIRLTDKFDLNFEGNATLYPEDFDGHLGDDVAVDMVAQGLIGITYKIGKSTWDVANPVNYEMVQDLNEKINILRAQLDAQAANPCPNCPPCPEGEVTEVVHDTIYATKDYKFLPDPVFFRIDKSVIDASEWSKIEKAVSYLGDNPYTNVVVTGYADRKTAYPAYNLRLSERRAKTVAKVLTTKYGINPLRVSINWEGDKIQPFEVNEWNRVVIFVIE